MPIDKYKILDNNRMPAHLEPKQNIIMLRKLMEQQEYIVAKVNQIVDNHKKLEAITMQYASSLGLLKQKIIHIETLQEKHDTYINSKWF